MRVAIAKPDYGIRGGFELVVDRIVDHLEASGHRITFLTVDARAPRSRIYDVDVPDEVRVQAAEYFRYVALIERFGQLDAGHADVVLCTQPGSWAVRHKRKLALFYHHLRVFYDLADLYTEAGFSDAFFHVPCTNEVRGIDQPLLEGVTHYLVPSQEVAGRLRRFNSIDDDRQSPFQAGYALDAQPPASASLPDGDGIALCASRHEWPKRTELVVAAAHHLRRMAPSAPARVILVGDGGRLGHIRALDRHAWEDGEAIDGPSSWNVAAVENAASDVPCSPNLEILGRVSTGELGRLFAGALCVIAPSLLEDYGLTAIEAMVHGKPVIACTDGGGLLDTVRNGENGLVVPPTGRAIAGAVELLRQDADLRAHLVAGARETAASYTWARAMGQLDTALDQALA